MRAVDNPEEDAGVLASFALRRPELGLKFTMSGYLRERSQRTRQGS